MTDNDARERSALTAWLDARSAWRTANGNYRATVAALTRTEDAPLGSPLRRMMPTPEDIAEQAAQVAQTARAVADTRAELDQVRADARMMLNT
jgi:hypothetical protein